MSSFEMGLKGILLSLSQMQNSDVVFQCPLSMGEKLKGQRNFKFDLCNINLINKNFCVAQDAMDTKGLGTPIEMLMSLMRHPGINK